MTASGRGSGAPRGTAGTLRQSIMARLARHAGLRHFYFFERALSPGAPPRVGSVSLRLASTAEAAAFARDPGLELREQSVADAFRRADLCVAAFEQDAVVGYCWLAFGPLHHLDGVTVDFAEHIVWTYRSFVRPSHRGRGIAPALYRFADAACLSRSRTLSIVCVESHNTASVEAARKAGYRPAGQALYLRRAASVKAWYADAVRRNRILFSVSGSES